jgi:hypothetical protein
MDSRKLILLTLALSAIACTDPLEGVWEGDCEGDDEPAVWELTIYGDGTGELEGVDANGHHDDADVDWEQSGGGYDLEIHFGGGKTTDVECELRDDDESLKCEVVGSSHEMVCELDRTQ